MVRNNFAGQPAPLSGPALLRHAIANPYERSDRIGPGFTEALQEMKMNEVAAEAEIKAKAKGLTALREKLAVA